MPSSSTLSTTNSRGVSDSSDEIRSSRNHASIETVAPGVAYLTTVFVNTYFVGEPGGPWVLVDTGLPPFAAAVRRAASERYGPDARPAAIILTHGHFDHSGAALELAEVWGVPIYAHPLELPYLTGRSDYPPQDPTVGGAIAFLSRFFPHSGSNLGSWIRPLPADGTVPGLPDWQWLHTPGHTPGHVSLLREADGVLLAGDAVTTMDLDSWSAQATERQEVQRPPTPLTTNWEAARVSVRSLAERMPSVVAAGHGIPIHGPQATVQLQDLAARFTPPPNGRYSVEPAYADQMGLVSVPPPVPDALPAQLAAVGALGLGAVAYQKWSQRGDSGLSGRPRLKPLQEQVIVITGASSGIGLATARAAVRAGASVVVASRSAPALQQLEQELSARGPGKAFGVVCDVSNETEVRQLARAAIDRFGGFDTWINNAGVSIYGKLEEVARDDMRQLFEINFWGVVHGSLAALEHLKTRPGGGTIINLGSALSERVIPLQGTYCASKFAVRGFTDALRMEVEKSGYPVSLTLVKPAAIDTPYVQHAKNYLSDEPKNPPPVYAPEVVAEVILHCAVTPERDRYAGGAAAAFGWMEKLMPRPTDKIMGAALFDQQHSGEPARPRGSGSLYQPSGPALRERGGYEGKVLETSPYDRIKGHRGALGWAALGATLLAAVLLAPSSSKQPSWRREASRFPAGLPAGNRDASPFRWK
ncbi:MAG: SDR family NAD(P)-dependent oxidoreductase [Cytophagales bacterium]|nr:SDR family NAD(P)-dependent oxidoreductase [Armatimonadota bacterium]